MEILTANEVVSGAVVYLATDGKWVPDIRDARIFDEGDSEARDAAIEAAHATLRLVSIEIEQISVVSGSIVPLRLRARIRANGPTAPYGPTRQYLGEDGHVSL